MNHQFEDLQAMFTSFLSKQNNNRGEPSFARDGVGNPVNLFLHKRGVFKRMRRWWLRMRPNSRVRKKVVLNFNGSDSTSWLVQTKNFFENHEIRLGLKVEMAFISMEGLAVH